MPSLSHNLFDYSRDQNGIVLVTLKDPYRIELEAQYPGCRIYYEKVIRHTNLWHKRKLLLQLVNIIVVDSSGQRHKSVILPDFILPHTRYIAPFFAIMLADIFDKMQIEQDIEQEELALYFIEFICQLKMHPENDSIENLKEEQQNTVYKKMGSYLKGRLEFVKKRVQDLKSRFIAIGNTSLQQTTQDNKSHPLSVMMSVSYRFLKCSFLCARYIHLKSTLLGAGFNRLFLSLSKDSDTIIKIPVLHEVMQMF